MRRGQYAVMVFLQISFCFALGILLTHRYCSHILRLCISSSAQLPKANMAGIPVVLPNSYFIPPPRSFSTWVLVTVIDTSSPLVSKWPKLWLLLHGLLLMFRFCLVHWCTFHNWGNMQKAFWKMEAVVAENSPNFRGLPARLLPHCVHLEASKRQSRQGLRFR